MRTNRLTSPTSTTPTKKLRSLRNAGPRIFGLLTPHLATILVGFIALALGSGINLLFPYLVRAAINEDLGLSLTEDLNFLVGVLILLFAIQSIFFCIRHFSFQVVGLRVVTKVRSDLFSTLLAQDIEFFDKSRVGDLLSRINSDTELLQRALTVNISVGLRYLVQVIGGLAMLIWISPSLSVVLLTAVPLIVFASMLWSRKLRSLSREMQNHLGDASVAAEEAVTSIRTVRIFAGEEREARRFNHSAEAALATGTKRTLIAALFSSSMVFLLHSSIAVVIWYGGRQVLSGALSIGDFTGFLLYVVLVAVSFAFLTSTWIEFLQAAGAAERIFDIIDETPKIKSATEATHSDGTMVSSRAQLVFSSVDFSYPTRSTIPVIEKLSFSIAKGETVALVGPSGAGKSTIAALTLRFYDPDSGTIFYDGKPLQAIPLTELRDRISVVSQQPQVFSISLRENIRYGRPNADDREIVRAARAACIDDFIESLPEGYDTIVGDKGIQLSGGERQRIAIARALLKNPEFLILDEATSALDSTNEALVQRALENIMKDRSALVIAHRLSTVQHADRVLVLRNGIIEQIGTHQQLMHEPGLYQTLVQHQLLS